ncbi:MAG TPA: hypothetical protein VLQ68_13220 [Rhizobiaceae bacterium]|nr:hypothetical protein [Rhizobiaceae bacterium]
MFHIRTDVPASDSLAAQPAAIVMGGERRSQHRRRVLKVARVVMAGNLATLDATVRDLNELGARIRVSGSVRLPEFREFELQITDEKRPRQARLAWRSGGEAGLSFTA